jgi:hypothetical protein
MPRSAAAPKAFTACGVIIIMRYTGIVLSPLVIPFV